MEAARKTRNCFRPPVRSFNLTREQKISKSAGVCRFLNETGTVS